MRLATDYNFWLNYLNKLNSFPGKFYIFPDHVAKLDHFAGTLFPQLLGVIQLLGVAD